MARLRRKRIVPATTSCGRPGNRSWARPSSTRSGTASCMMASLPAASFPKSFPRSPRSPCGARALARRRCARSRPRRDLRVAWRSSFLPSPSLHDGRFANDGWLQELPDPLTKLTWDNPALVSPKTAETLGLASEDVVRLDYAGRSLELPVWILPGMADGVVALTLGYGRVARGPDWVGSRVRRVHGPKLQSTRLRQRGQPHQARAHATRSRRPRSTAAWRGARSCASRP